MKENQEAKPKGIPVGDPIYIESLMNRQEWKQRYGKYSSSSVPEPPAFFDSAFKWRYGMGAGLSKTEMDNINFNIDYLKKQIKPEK